MFAKRTSLAFFLAACALDAGAQSRVEQAYELSHSGKPAEAVPLLEAELAEMRGVLGENSPGITATTWSLATALNDSSKYARAEPVYLQVLRNEEAAFGADSRELLPVLMHLAGNFMDQGNFSAAEPHYQRLLAILEISHGRDDVNLMTPLNALGTLYFRDGRLPLARETFERVLALQQASRDGNARFRVAYAQQNLAVVLAASGENARAEALLEQVKAFWGKQDKDDRSRWQQARSLLNLAKIYRSTGRETQALKLEARAAKLSQGIDPRDISSSRANWGQSL